MNCLNFFYENPPIFEPSPARKISLFLNQNILIKGPRHGGKRSLISSFLAGLKKEEFLYLDLADPRFEDLGKIKLFLAENTQIKILALLNLTEDLLAQLGEDFFEDFKNMQIIISTNCKDMKLKNFKEIFLDFFDYEESLSLRINSSGGVSDFLQNGRGIYAKNYQSLNADFSKIELEILKIIAQKIGQELSVAQIFNELKIGRKLSKNNIYDLVKKLENNFIITQLKHQDKRMRKFYFQDFGMRRMLSLSKNFKASFENLILNELAKKRLTLHYDKHFSFIAAQNKLALISAPTLDLALIKLKRKRLLPHALERGILKIFFITLSSEGGFLEQGVKFEILPFEKWALSL